MKEKAQDVSYSSLQYEHTSKLIYINLFYASHDGIMRHKKTRIFQSEKFLEDGKSF